MSIYELVDEVRQSPEQKAFVLMDMGVRRVLVNGKVYGDAATLLAFDGARAAEYLDMGGGITGRGLAYALRHATQGNRRA